MLVVSIMGKVKMEKVVTVMWILGASAWAQTPDNFSTTQKPSCFRGWTGPDSGGSCSFTTGTFCDWRVVQSDDILWSLTDDNEAKLDPGWWSDFERGRLRSPPLCEQAGRQVCVQIKFRFNRGGGSRLYASVCGQGTTCTSLFRYVYNDNTDWIVKTVKFVTQGIFEIFIVGEKYKDTFGGESAMFVDYIRYNSTSCGEEDSRVSSLSTMESTWADSSTGPTTNEVTGAGTEQGITDIAGTTGITGPASTANVGESGNGSSGAEGVKKTAEDEGDEEEAAISSTVVVVIVCAGVLLLLAVSILLAIFIFRRRHSKAPHAVTGPQARTERNESIVTFTNELYTSVGQCSDIGPQQDVTEGSARHTTPRPVTSAERSSNNSDVHHTSMNCPASSPAKVTTQVSSSKKQTGLDMTRLDEVTSSSPTEEVVYDSADIVHDKKKEDDTVYENTDARSADDKLYENTAPRDSKPAASAASGGADDTYDKVGEPTAEYSHLINPTDRPDRRRDNYDHMTQSN